MAPHTSRIVSKISLNMVLPPIGFHLTLPYLVVDVNTTNKKNGGRKEYVVQALIDSNPGESAIEYSIKAGEQLAAERTYKKLVEEGVIRPSTNRRG